MADHPGSNADAATWPDAHWAAVLPPPPQPALDVRRLTAAALAAPRDFPAIEQAVVPGDRVVIAAETNVPQLADVLRGIVDALPVAALEAVDVLVSDEARPELIDQLREALPSQVVLTQHTPEDREALALLAANESGEPLYLHRLLADADFVLPVVVARPADSLEPPMRGGQLAPTLADPASRRRFRYNRLARRESQDREAREVAWLLGVQLLVAIMPARDGSVFQILAGDPESTAEAAAALVPTEDPTAKAASSPGTGAADLVIAPIAGGPEQQTWQNVGRALHAARRWVRPGGTIVIDSALQQPPRGSLRRLAEGRDGDEDAIRKQLVKDDDPSATTAVVMLDALRDGRVILKSQLPVEEVELLGLGAIPADVSLSRLVQGHEDYVVLPAAHLL